ncbi:MAG: hypothetical protein J7501_00915, partial [Bdellovibrio sp.]|nr:hypothetical protein [Bdellovibrio sp.]
MQRKAVLFLALFAGSSQPVFALTSDQVIKSAWSDRSYMIQDELQATSSKNPLRHVEAFASNENAKNGKSETEYGLKFQFKSWPEWRGHRSRYDEQKLLRESTLSWALRDRYAALTTFDLSEKMIKALADAEVVANRNVQAQGVALKAGKITSRAYLKAQVEQVKVKRALTAAKEEAELCRKKIKIWIPDWQGDAPTDLKSWNVDEIQSFLQMSVTGEKSLSRRIATEELNLLSDELMILRGRESQWLKSIDVSQTQKKDETSFEVGLTLLLPGLG